MYIHPSALVEEGAIIGNGTRVWHLVQVRAGAKIGEDCITVLSLATASKSRTMCRSTTG